MARFAENTSVDVATSRAELERTLIRYGADGFAYGWEGGRAMVQFRSGGRFVRFLLPIPPRSDFELTETGKARTSEQAITKSWEQAQRQRWRALNLVVKAKLEAVEAGITSFDEEFLAHIVLPDNTTVAEQAVPAVALAYETGRMPELLPGPSRG